MMAVPVVSGDFLQVEWSRGATSKRSEPLETFSIPLPTRDMCTLKLAWEAPSIPALSLLYRGGIGGDPPLPFAR
jgi:hypothetical protein